MTIRRHVKEVKRDNALIARAKQGVRREEVKEHLKNNPDLVFTNSTNLPPIEGCTGNYKGDVFVPFEPSQMRFAQVETEKRFVERARKEIKILLVCTLILFTFIMMIVFFVERAFLVWLN